MTRPRPASAPSRRGPIEEPDARTGTSKGRAAIAVGCCFLSGAAGLLYEVCWIRRASLVFGSTIFALSTVVALFFLGLAAGSELFGRRSQRTRHPLRTYALLEIALAALALSSLPAFDIAERLFAGAYRAFGDSPALLAVARIALVSGIVLPPTILMGGTLPLFSRHFIHSRTRIAGSFGLLYAINTLGGAVGCAAAGVVLIPTLGLWRPVALGAALNVIAAVAVWVLGPPSPIAPPAVVRRGRAVSDARWGVVALLVFLTGIAAVGQEMVWTRYLALLVQNTVHTFTITLTVVLTGIVLGGLAAAQLFDRELRRMWLFELFQILFALTVLAQMTLPASFWQQMGNALSLSFVLFLPPAILSGASLPLAVRMAIDDPAAAGIAVGRARVCSPVLR